MSVPTPAQLTKTFKTMRAFGNVLNKILVTHLQDGNCRAEMKISEEHTNPMGGLHGGLSATIVDEISSYALVSQGRGLVPSVSINMNITYMKGAVLGDEIVIDAKTLRSGRTLAFLEVLITNKSTGELLVKGEHTKFFLDK